MEAVDRDPDLQSALVSVIWRGWLCYRRRLHLDDPGQRARFVKNTLLSCHQAGIRRVDVVAACVTPAALIRLANDYRERPRHLPVDPVAEKARRATIGAAARRAGALRNAPDILARVAAAIQANGYAGNVAPAVLAYVALTSRLLERPINLAFVGEASAGKNAIIDAARALVPPEAVYVFTAGSPRALLYTSETLEHRVVVFKEADSIPDDGPAASAVRALAHDHEVRYEVTGFSATAGTFETQTITKKGPTGLLTTSTRALAPQLNTRVLVMPVEDDDGKITRKVLLARGQEAAGRTRRRRGVDVEAFVAFQRWLALAGEHRVVVPFADVLAELMPAAPELRMRRDFVQLLSCVQTIALLRRQHQRHGGPAGEIVATFDDYARARDLLLPCFDALARGGVSTVIRQTVEEIRQDERDVSVSGLAERLGISRQCAWARVKRAIKGKWLINDAPGSGKPARLRRDRPLPAPGHTLPEAERVQAAVCGVPEPVANVYYLEFAGRIAAWKDVFTAKEWAGQVQRDVTQVRARLDRLVRAKLLGHSGRIYVLPSWVRDRVREAKEGRRSGETDSLPGAVGGTNGRERDNAAEQVSGRPPKAGHRGPGTRADHPDPAAPPAGSQPEELAGAETTPRRPGRNGTEDRPADTLGPTASGHPPGGVGPENEPPPAPGTGAAANGRSAAERGQSGPQGPVGEDVPEGKS